MEMTIPKFLNPKIRRLRRKHRIKGQFMKQLYMLAKLLNEHDSGIVTESDIKRMIIRVFNDAHKNVVDSKFEVFNKLFVREVHGPAYYLRSLRKLSNSNVMKVDPDITYDDFVEMIIANTLVKYHMISYKTLAELTGFSVPHCVKLTNRVIEAYGIEKTNNYIEVSGRTRIRGAKRIPGTDTYGIQLSNSYRRRGALRTEGVANGSTRVAVYSSKRFAECCLNTDIVAVPGNGAIALDIAYLRILSLTKIGGKKIARLLSLLKPYYVK